MKITKKEIKENLTKGKIDKNIFSYQYDYLNKDRYSVRCYRFGNRPPEYVTSGSGMSIGHSPAKNINDFVDIVYHEIKSNY